jgi:hypothetical protein
VLLAHGWYARYNEAHLVPQFRLQPAPIPLDSVGVVGCWTGSGVDVVGRFDATLLMTGCGDVDVSKKYIGVTDDMSIQLRRSRDRGRFTGSFVLPNRYDSCVNNPRGLFEMHITTAPPTEPARRHDDTGVRSGVLVSPDVRSVRVGVTSSPNGRSDDCAWCRLPSLHAVTAPMFRGIFVVALALCAAHLAVAFEPSGTWSYFDRATPTAEVFAVPLATAAIASLVLSLRLRRWSRGEVRAPQRCSAWHSALPGFFIFCTGVLCVAFAIVDLNAASRNIALADVSRSSSKWAVCAPPRSGEFACRGPCACWIHRVDMCK